MYLMSRLRAAAVASAIACAIGAAPALAQTVGTRIAVGSVPKALAVNPVTGKVYVANSGSDTVSVINGTTLSVATTITLPAPASGTNHPAWIAVNPETNTVYVSNLLSANSMVINGATDTYVKTLLSGGGGWTAINPLTDSVYVIRYGSADEVNTIQHDFYKLTSAFFSFTPMGIAFNPATSRMYVPTQNPGDVAAFDMSVQTPYPEMLCPNGAGGFKPQPPTPPAPYNQPCVDVANPPVAVALNVATNTVYSLSDSATAQLTVINGTTHAPTTITLNDASALTGARAIAVDPIRNLIYAAFVNGVARINGSNGTFVTYPLGTNASTGPVAIGINLLTGVAYIPRADGNLLSIRPDGTTTSVAIPAGANAISVNPADNRVWISDTAGGVTPVTGLDVGHGNNGIAVAIQPLAGNNGRSGGTINMTASSSNLPAGVNTVRKVYWRIGTSGPWNEAAQTENTWTAIYSGLANGQHTLYAYATVGLEAPNANAHPADAPLIGNIASYTFNVTQTAPPEAVLSPTSVNFGGQSMGTTSPAQEVTVTNIGQGTLTISAVETSTTQFGRSHNCSTLATGQTCTVTLTFTPAPAAGAVNSTTPVNGTLSVTSNGTGSPNAIALAGTAEKSLITHFYLSALRRQPDSGGKSFWATEATRMGGLGANVNETWFSMATFFYFSPEYTEFARDNTGFATDLYKTFFNREPDSGGLNFWVGQMNSGMPREVVLVSFMFSPEFTGFAQNIFGNTAARAEVDMVMDFYRGILSRLPDTNGFNYWVQQFRTAQCQGAAAVNAQVEAISNAFITSGEYTARNRTNPQYVGDLYNAFLRRGGDAAGVQAWINELNTRNRSQVRQAFIASQEFQARVTAVVNQGCLQ